VKNFAIQFAIGAQLSGAFAKTFGTANGKLTALGKTMSSLEREQSQLNTAYNNSKKFLQSYQNEVNKLNIKQQALINQQRMVEAAFDSGHISQKKYEQLTGRLSSKINQVTEAQRKLTTEYNRANGVVNSFTANQRRLSQQLDNTRNSQERLQSAVELQNKLAQAKETAFGVASAVGSIALAMAVPIKQAMTFESKMADVKKVVNFDTPEQFANMRDDIIALSTELPMTAEGLADIVAAGGQSGIAREDLLAFAEDAAKMGTAFDITSDEAGEMMAKWRTAFQMGQDEVVELADKINYLGNNTAASAPKISDVVRRIGPLGSIGGIASGEIAALGASMVGAGTESDVAATGIKNLMLGMVVGNQATKTQAEMFDKLGFSTTELAKRMQVDAKGAILDVLGAIQKLPKDEQATTLMGIFGKESAEAIGPLLSNLDNLKRNFDLVADSSNYAGSMQAEFEARCDTTENSLQLLKNQVNAVAVTVGNQLLPYIKNAIDTFRQGASAIMAFAQANPKLTSGLVVGVGAFVAIASVITIASYALLAFIYPFTQLRSMMLAFNVATKLAAAGQWALNIAMSANPIGLVIAGIAALIGIGYLLYKNWDSIKVIGLQVWTSLSNGVYSAAISIKNFFVGIINSGLSFISGLGNTIGNGINSAKIYVINGLSVIVGFISSLPNKIAYNIGYIIGVIMQLPTSIPIMASYFMANLTTWGSNAYTTATMWIINTVNGVYQNLLLLPGYCLSVGAYVVTSLVAWLSNAYSTATTWTNNIVNTVYQVLLNLPSYCMQAGMQFVANVESWASSAYNAVASWINQIPNLVATALANAASSASSWWEGVKASFTIGMEEGSAKPQMALASGGIFNKGAFITSFAEDSPEAAIPIDGSRRAIALWQKTGELLGINNFKNNKTKGKYNKPIVQSVNKTIVSSNKDETSGIKDYILSGLQKIVSFTNNRYNNILLDKKQNNVVIPPDILKFNRLNKDKNESSEIKNNVLSRLQAISLLTNIVQAKKTNERNNALLNDKPNNIFISFGLSKTNNSNSDNEDETGSIKNNNYLPEILNLNGKENITSKNKITPIFMPIPNYSEKTNLDIPKINLFDTVRKFLNENSVSNVTNNSSIGDNRVNITYSPNINIKSDGKNENLVNNVKQALTTDKENLIQLIQKVLKDMDNDKNRLAFN
jgi:TP901 family phage tail tape measure protein